MARTEVNLTPAQKLAAAQEQQAQRAAERKRQQALDRLQFVVDFVADELTAEQLADGLDRFEMLPAVLEREAEALRQRRNDYIVSQSGATLDAIREASQAAEELRARFKAMGEELAQADAAVVAMHTARSMAAQAKQRATSLIPDGLTFDDVSPYLT